VSLQCGTARQRGAGHTPGRRWSGCPRSCRRFGGGALGAGTGGGSAANCFGLHRCLPARSRRFTERAAAATHWVHCAELGRRFPALRVEPDPIFVRDGAIWTSAGVTAAIDLALALVEEDVGRSLALAVARHLVMFLKRPGGQAQFSTVLSLQGAEDRSGALHSWMAGRLTDDLSLPTLARKAGMSERSFSRRYAEATGITPARAVERLRVEAARRLLSDTRLPVKRIAARCGFGSEETLRRSFVRLLAATPQDYRARFSG
jgi:transcriptional regulator GlxA family with amidase domain